MHFHFATHPFSCAPTPPKFTCSVAPFCSSVTPKMGSNSFSTRLPGCNCIVKGVLSFATSPRTRTPRTARMLLAHRADLKLWRVILRALTLPGSTSQFWALGSRWGTRSLRQPGSMCLGAISDKDSYDRWWWCSCCTGVPLWRIGVLDPPL